MATTHIPKLTTRESIIKCNAAVARRLGMSLAVYKTFKLLTQSAGVGAVIYAMSLGGDPTTALLIIGGVLVGPEFLEFAIAQNESRD